jgi:hypothetical protein
VFRALNKKLLAVAKTAAMERPCPNCGKKFKPFADREFTSWSDFNQPSACPKCGHAYTIEELARSPDDAKANPRGPFARPFESRIERRQPAPHQLEFHIPPHGRWGAWLFIAIVWNLIAWPNFFGLVATIGTPAFQPQPFMWLSLFVITGLGLIYVALRQRYGSTLLELTPGTMRLQRTLFGASRSHDVYTAEVRNVSKVLFYTKNYQPVYGIEIKTMRRQLRFGSALTEDEKNWLCWEIQEFVRAHANQASVDPAVQALTRRL